MKDHPCCWAGRKRGWSSPELAVGIANEGGDSLDCFCGDGDVQMQPGMSCKWKDVDGVDDGFDDVECDGGKDDEDSNVPSKKAGN